MAVKKPLIYYDDTKRIEELRTTDTLFSASATTITTVEKNLGTPGKRSGTFDITGLTGLTTNKQVLISQATGPYTGKGTREDEAEMDMIQTAGFVLNATTIRVFWNTNNRMRVLGNFKFNYFIQS